MKLLSSRAFLIALSLILLTGVARAQLPKNCGEATVKIELQETPPAMEPVAEPPRKSVPDRATVSVCVANLSPLDLCTVGGLTSKPLVEKSAFEAIIQSLTGLGGLSLGNGSPYKGPPAFPTTGSERQLETLNKDGSKKIPFEQDADVQRFNKLLQQLDPLLRNVSNNEKAKSELLRSDTKDLEDFLAKNYRGGQWKLFNLDTIARIRDDANPFHLQIQPNLGRAKDILEGMTALLPVIRKKVENGVLSEKDADGKNEVELLSQQLAENSSKLDMLVVNGGILSKAQAALQTLYESVEGVHRAFRRRVEQGILVADDNGKAPLYQIISFGTDHKTTLTGNISCVNLADGKTATTDPIRFSFFYRPIPSTTASLGFLVTTLGKNQVGTQQVSSPGSTGGVANLFALTGTSAAQLFPMVFLNQRVGPAKLTHWWHRPEDELDITTSLSAGFGVNPNSGTNQPEFFTGFALGLNRLIFHPGVHFGRTQELGGGFRLGDAVPSGLTAAPPIDWHYHPAFSIGFSVRTAPW